MLTFKRSLIVAIAVIILFFFFFSGHKNLSAKDLLHDADLESKILSAKQETEDLLRELQDSAVKKADLQEQRIHDLEKERKLLDKQLAQMRRLPAGSSIRTQLAYQFPFDLGSRFPAYIWQTWKQDLDDPKFDPKFRNTVSSWKDKNQAFVHEVLSDATANTLIRHLYMNVPSVIDAYESMPENILRADFFRYLILLARGGTYSDVDTEALQAVPSWIPEHFDPMRIGLIIGIEADPDREDWHEWYARRIQFCQWTIQSKPGHPVLREIVANITETTLQKKKDGVLPIEGSADRGGDIMDWTGPGIWTDTIFAYLNTQVKSGLYYPVTWRNFTGMTDPKLLSDTLVLPITSFSPGVRTMGSESEDHPLAYVKHHFEGSWKPEEERHIGE